MKTKISISFRTKLKAQLPFLLILKLHKLDDDIYYRDILLEVKGRKCKKMLKEEFGGKQWN